MHENKYNIKVVDNKKILINKLNNVADVKNNYKKKNYNINFNKSIIHNGINYNKSII